MNQPPLFPGIHPSIHQVTVRERERHASGKLTPKELAAAQKMRSTVFRGCPHEVPCSDGWERCVERIARHQRRMGHT